MTINLRRYTHTGLDKKAPRETDKGAKTKPMKGLQLSGTLMINHPSLKGLISDLIKVPLSLYKKTAKKLRSIESNTAVLVGGEVISSTLDKALVQPGTL